MQALERAGHAVPYNINASGPTARSLGGFLKKSGRMGGGDSPYYWGYVLLEKLRVGRGEKKSKARERAEEEWVLFLILVLIPILPLYFRIFCLSSFISHLFLELPFTARTLRVD